jgi:hypothetical protein
VPTCHCVQRIGSRVRDEHETLMRRGMRQRLDGRARTSLPRERIKEGLRLIRGADVRDESWLCKIGLRGTRVMAPGQAVSGRDRSDERLDSAISPISLVKDAVGTIVLFSLVAGGKGGRCKAG